jgi:NADPH-dependent curcumin reductase CurA
MKQQYQRIVLASRPRGPVRPENFRLETLEVPDLEDGHVLVRNAFLSLDPYMRGRMSDAKSYAAAQPLDETMVGETAGVVGHSRHPDFAPGDTVTGRAGWATLGILPGAALRRVRTDRVPLSAHLGVVGMPGVTAWYGVRDILDPQPGQTVLVSAASGAVGSVAGQLARRRGCRVVGIAGGPEKCAWVVEELGFPACVDYRSATFAEELAAATPDGIDGLFENVGGTVFDAALARMNAFGRVALCGLMSGLTAGHQPIHNMRAVLLNRLSLRGFIITEHPEVWPQALGQLETLVADGQLRYRENIAHGLAAAPGAFIELLAGRHFGKQLVRLDG